ncbi:unnamed protein product [Durusdinium trenchii]|uniref:Uncharacterized protein n=1 Tax=Durusdinium trenchii TaxID=1381693 RepID=A0ABP0S425_9DINO
MILDLLLLPEKSCIFGVAYNAAYMTMRDLLLPAPQKDNVMTSLRIRTQLGPTNEKEISNEKDMSDQDISNMNDSDLDFGRATSKTETSQTGQLSRSRSPGARPLFRWRIKVT